GKQSWIAVADNIPRPQTTPADAYLCLRYHFEHGITIGLASISEQRLNGCNEGFVFLRRQHIDFTAFCLDCLVGLVVFFDRELALIGDRFSDGQLHCTPEAIRPTLERRTMQKKSVAKCKSDC